MSKSNTYPEYNFDLDDFEDVARIKEYIDCLHRIVILKNSDSEKSPDGGASCRLIVTIKAKEEWI